MVKKKHEPPLELNPIFKIEMEGREAIRKMRKEVGHVELIGELTITTLAYLQKLAMQKPKTAEEYHAFSDLLGKIFWIDDLELNG